MFMYKFCFEFSLFHLARIVTVYFVGCKGYATLREDETLTLAKKIMLKKYRV